MLFKVLKLSFNQSTEDSRLSLHEDTDWRYCGRHHGNSVEEGDDEIVEQNEVFEVDLIEIVQRLRVDLLWKKYIFVNKQRMSDIK